MKVLHLPVNVASIPSHTVRGLKKIGIDARGLIFDNKYCQSSKGMTVIRISGSKKFEKELKKIVFTYNFFKSVRWADIIHWYFGSSILPWNIDIKWIHLLKKPSLIEWLGSDIRIPEIEFNDNPYYRKVFPNIKIPSKQFKKSIKKQEMFIKNGFIAIVPPCMQQYLQKHLWPEFYIFRQRIMLSDYVPCYPSPETKKPIVVHSPTNPVIKGTPIVIEIINKLKKKYAFEFKLIENVKRTEALEIMKNADIFLDQFVLGAHGMACLEAMAYGKPVLCYIKPSLIPQYPDDLPIVNANPDNLEIVLEELLLNGKKDVN